MIEEGSRPSHGLHRVSHLFASYLGNFLVKKSKIRKRDKRVDAKR